MSKHYIDTNLNISVDADVEIIHNCLVTVDFEPRRHATYEDPEEAESVELISIKDLDTGAMLALNMYDDAFTEYVLEHINDALTEQISGENADDARDAMLERQNEDNF